MTECGTDSPTERILAAEYLDCCICLAAYNDGAELRELPCGHHFHCACIDKWLHINATCPLCKYDILKQSHNDIEEVRPRRLHTFETEYSLAPHLYISAHLYIYKNIHG